MIDKMVYECIEKHKGGTKFFDALDEMIREDEELFSTLLATAYYQVGRSLAEHDAFLSESFVVIVSGRFGISFSNWAKVKDINCVVLEGALRFNSIENPEQYYNQIKHRHCVFIDDSFFSGKTYEAVRKMVVDAHGHMVGAVVAYDGSHDLRSDVHGLFRYYDVFGEEK